MPNGPCHLLVADTSDSGTFCKVRILERESDESSESNDDEETTTEVDFNEDENSSSAVSEGNHPEKLELSIGDWIVVKYQGELFPGEITESGGFVQLRSELM